MRWCLDSCMASTYSLEVRVHNLKTPRFFNHDGQMVKLEVKRKS